jgi:hypothetical protein
MLEGLSGFCGGIYRKRVGTKTSVRIGGTLPVFHRFPRTRGEAAGSVHYSNCCKPHNHIDEIKYNQIQSNINIKYNMIIISRSIENQEKEKEK